MTPRILLFIPMYRCERQITRVLARITPAIGSHIAEVMVVDNRSPDGSVSAALAGLAGLSIPVRVCVNHANLNLGGSHKVAFDRALDEGFTHVAVLHGDDQADPADLLPLFADGSLDRSDCLLGSRFCRGSRLHGYSLLRTTGNRVFNLLFSAATGRWISDLGSGLNIFAMGWLADRAYRRLNDDLTFNNQFLLLMIQRQARMRFFPISWREEDQISNVRLFRQAWRTLGIVGGYAIRRGAYLRPHRGGRPLDGYTTAIVHEHRP